MKIDKFLLFNDKIKLEILNYGAVISSLEVVDHNKCFENIVCAYQNVEDYIENDVYLGCVVGPTSGRIYNGQYKLNDKTYHLTINGNKHHLHGGFKNFSKTLFKVIKHTNTKIVLEANSNDFNQGYDVGINLKVTYELIDNQLVVSYDAISEELTLCDITQHTYFNLSGNLKEDINNCWLEINADKYLTLDSDGMVTNEIIDVEDVFDTRTPICIKDITSSKHDQILKGNNGYDHNFILNKNKVYDIKLVDKNSKRYLKVKTDNCSVVCYMANHLDDSYLLKDNVKSKKHLGICFETMNIANGINNDLVKEKPIIDKNKPYSKKTIFEFGIVE